MKRIISLMLVGMIVLGLSGCFTKAPKLTVTQSDIVVEVNDETFTLDSLSDYIQASDYKNNVIPFADLTIMGDYDLSKIGVYQLTITAKANNASTVETVNINVVDTTKPVFNVVSDEVLVYLGTEFSADAEMNLLFAEDNNDKNVTERITYVGEVDPKRAGVYPVEYTVSDASGNTASTTITYRVTDSLDEYVSYLYKRTIDFYWGKYFITDNDQTVTNYDSAVYYFFTNNGQQQFERACGLAENTDDTAGGIQLVKTDDQIYMYDQEKIVVNNYLATTLTKAYQKGIYLRFYAVASYGNGIETIMTQDSLFSLKRVEGKWYVDNFALPN